MSTGTTIPPLRGADPGMPVRWRRRSRRQLSGFTWSPSRRNILRAGGVLGLTVLGGVFPTVRRAVADGYDIYPSCPSYADDHDCSPGCGSSTIFADACETSGPNLGFHKDDQVTWRLRPNGCFDGSYDGWMWRHDQACGACSCHIERRCHDGYRRTDSGWVKSICRWTTDCGCPETVSWPAVGSGSTGDVVSTIQHLLTFHGISVEVDGVYGSATAAAVREFQSATGLPVTGAVAGATWPSLAVTTRTEDSGEQVRATQVQLNRYGYQLSVDGVFGPATHASASDFQRHNRLSVDGVVGQQTWRTLVGGAV